MSSPDWTSALRERLAGLALTPVREADIIEELAAHLDERFRELCLDHDAMEARRLALGELDAPGSLAARLRTLRQASANVRRPLPPGAPSRGWVAGLAGDLRYATRMLRKHPSFTLTVIIILALGIGANTAIFSVIDAVLLRATPFTNMDRLLMIWETDRDSGTVREPASFPDFLDFRERSQHVAEVAALMGTELNATTDDGTPLRLAGLAVTHDLLPLLGLQPILGRTFSAAEDRPGGPNVGLISDGLWTRLFSRDPAIVGQTIRLNDIPTTIIGVLPKGSDLGALQLLSAAAYSRAFADRGTHAEVDVWIPRQWDAESVPRATHPIFVVGRLAPGATMASAQDELTNIATDLERAYPENDARGVFVEPLSEVIFGPVRPALWLIAGAVGLVLLVTCANVATLLLARGAARTREVALRRALGASGWHLTRQFLAESLLLTGVASVVGVAVAAAGLDLLIGMAPANVPRLGDAHLNLQVLSLATVLAIVVGLTFAMIPVSQAWRLDLQSACKGAAPMGAVGSRGRGPGRALVVTQVAVAVVLVVGTGLLVRSFWSVLAVDAGFQTGGVLKAEYQLPDSRYPTDMRTFPNFAEAHTLNREVLSRISATPGVTAVALAGNHPLDAGFTNSFVVVGREAEASD